MGKMKEYKQLQQELIKQHFESEILSHLKDKVTIYYGMGTYGLENDPNDYLPTRLDESICSFIEELLPFNNKELDPVYIYFELLDCATNLDNLTGNECDKINISSYKQMFM